MCHLCHSGGRQMCDAMLEQDYMKSELEYRKSRAAAMLKQSEAIQKEIAKPTRSSISTVCLHV